MKGSPTVVPPTELRTDPRRAGEALMLSSIPALRRLTVEEEPALLVLKGRLPSYYYKQLAQEAVLPFLGGRELVNQVVVVQHG